MTRYPASFNTILGTKTVAFLLQAYDNDRLRKTFHNGKWRDQNVTFRRRHVTIIKCKIIRISVTLYEERKV